MEFDYAYHKASGVRDSADQTSMSFAPDLKREPTHFRGELRHKLAFRECISALHDVVIADLRFKPRDREEYKAWAARQEEAEVAKLMAASAEIKSKMDVLQAQLKDLRGRHEQRFASFYKARQKYFDFLYKKDYDAWFVLDPVVTIHPDQVFFECFSQDESMYGRLSVNYEGFASVGDFSCGTTNVDYSQKLYDEFQKIRTYKQTFFEVDPGGFEIQTQGEEDYKEVKIDLPDTWVRGFLQVSSAMTLPGIRFQLHPMDVHNICFYLRRHREVKGPRSLIYILEPDKPVRLVVEPWNYEIICPRSIFKGDQEHRVRVWGRRRIHALERLLQRARKFDVVLLGSGMPSFYIADLGHMSFTLGLSGWTNNDWSRSGNFDLLNTRQEADEISKKRVFEYMQTHYSGTAGDLSSALNMDRQLVLASLGAYTQAGRVMYDMDKGLYRLRELTREPLPMDRLRFSNEREAAAAKLLNQNAIVQFEVEERDGNRHLRGRIKDGSKTLDPTLIMDGDDRLLEATCQCRFYQTNKMYKGPCEHILALRAALQRKTGAKEIAATV